MKMGLSAKELRIGNLVIHEATTHKIISLQRFGCESEWNDSKQTNRDVYYHKHYNGIKPIPLTEEWLVKFGFEENTTRYLKCSFSLWQFINKDWKVAYGESEMTIKVDLKYVHQLQNLYFALTGEELILKNNE